jgi:hypothetical protein
MWWWWVFTFIHNCAWFWFIAINTKIPKMNFNEQPNMFYGNIFSYTCYLHFKLNILNPLNTIVLSNSWKKSPFPCNPFFQNLNTLKFLNNLVLYQVHIMNRYFHRRGHVFVVQKVWNQLYDFMHSFWFLFNKM